MQPEVPHCGYVWLSTSMLRLLPQKKSPVVATDARETDIKMAVALGSVSSPIVSGVLRQSISAR